MTDTIDINIGTPPSQLQGTQGGGRTQQIKILVAAAANNEGEWVSAQMVNISAAAGPELYAHIGRHFGEITYRQGIWYVRFFDKKEV